MAATLQRSFVRQLALRPVTARAVCIPAARAFSAYAPLRNAKPPSSGNSEDEELLQKIKDEVKAAMKGKQSDVVSTLRSLLSDHQYATKAGGGSASSLTSILQKAIARRKDSAEQYIAAKRQDLADKEHSEASLIERFLPTQLGEQELRTIVEQAVSVAKGQGVEAKKLLGVVMKEVKGRVGGKADGKRLKEVIEGVVGKGDGK